MTAIAAGIAQRVGSWFARPSAQVAAAEQAALRSDRFRLEREADWMRLENILKHIEAGRFRAVPDKDLLALPTLYRTAASSLAIARETSLDAALVAYLEALTQRAWFLVYGPRTSLWSWVRSFLGGGWSASVRGLGIDLLIALALMGAGIAVGWLLVDANPDWYQALVPGGFADERVPGASREALHDTLFGNQNQNGMSVFAAGLFSNNARVSILCFALGFAFGLPTILLLIHNTALLGALLWLYNGQGLLLDLVGWLSIHGTTELFAILLAGAAGIHVGRSMAFPGNLAVLDAAAAAGRRSAQVMTGVVLMLVIAALLEGFARQLVDSTLSRLSVGGVMLVLWIGYFFAFRRRAQ